MLDVKLFPILELKLGNLILEMVVHHVCGSCGRFQTAPTVSDIFCGCGHRYRMLFVCMSCREDFQNPDEYTAHCGQCNCCPICWERGLSFIDLIRHLFPFLFPNNNLHYGNGIIGPCMVLYAHYEFRRN